MEQNRTTTRGTTGNGKGQHSTTSRGADAFSNAGVVRMPCWPERNSKGGALIGVRGAQGEEVRAPLCHASKGVGASGMAIGLGDGLGTGRRPIRGRQGGVAHEKAVEGAGSLEAPSACGVRREIAPTTTGFRIHSAASCEDAAWPSFSSSQGKSMSAMPASVARATIPCQYRAGMRFSIFHWRTLPAGHCSLAATAAPPPSASMRLR